MCLLFLAFLSDMENFKHGSHWILYSTFLLPSQCYWPFSFPLMLINSPLKGKGIGLFPWSKRILLVISILKGPYRVSRFYNLMSVSHTACPHVSHACLGTTTTLLGEGRMKSGTGVCSLGLSSPDQKGKQQSLGQIL